MKRLIWGCTQMIVGMLGVIASLLALAAASYIGGSVLFLICFLALILFAAMAFLGWFDHVRPEVKDLKTDEKSE